jgi:hypothetical protein
MRIEPSFVEEQRNRYAGQNLAWLILLNGAAALVILAAVAYAPQSTFETKLGAAMMVFGGGAIAGLVSSFFAYVNRTLRMEGENALLYEIPCVASECWPLWQAEQPFSLV